MIFAHRIALDPTMEQRNALARACGVARFTYNWALAEWNRQYAAGERPTALKLKTLWNGLKHHVFPWVSESPKDANQQPFLALHQGFQAFFRKEQGPPRFKKKGEHDSFYVSNDKLRMEPGSVRLPIIGWIRTREALRLFGKIMSATVSREADRWFISVAVDVGDEKKPRFADGSIGIDLGVKTAIVCSDGQTFNAPKPLKANLDRLRRLSRRHSRKQKGSQNRKKSQMRLARLHARIKNIRKDWTHQVTTKLARENQTICLEDLSACEMGTRRETRRAVNDVSLYEIRRQLEYKALVYGGRVVVIDRWLPTSKKCSNCGCVKDVLALSERVYHCGQCGYEADRDLNAACNILAAGLAVSACGPEGSDAGDVANVKPRRDEAGTRPWGRASASAN